MVRLAEEHPSVAIVGAYTLHGTEVVNVGLPYLSTVVPGREACRMRLLGGPYVFGSATSVLFRSDIVRSRHAFYNEANLHADTEACYEFLENRDFGFVHQVLTYFRTREGSLTSFSQTVNTYYPAGLYVLLRYGPKYLSDGELNSVLRVRLRNYYRYLGWQIYKLRGREFWTYHREKLAELGFPLSKSRLAISAVLYALDLILNPKRTVGRMLRRFRRASSRSTR
jgi:hypothetical protein